MNVFGPPRRRTQGRSVLPRVRTERFCWTIASKREAISSGAGTPCFWRPLMSVSAKTPHLPATGWSFWSAKESVPSVAGSSLSLAVILSMTAPVPPAHLSFMLGNFLFRPVDGSGIQMMILASWPPSSMTLPASGWSVSTARETAFTSWTNRAPMKGARTFPPLPVMKARGGSPRRGNRRSIASRNPSVFSAWRVSWRS